MNKYLILLIILVVIIIIILFFKFNEYEYFLPSNYDTSDGSDYIQFNQSSPSQFNLDLAPSDNNCCLVEKEFVYDPSSKNNGRFTYIYKKINYPEFCKNDLHDLKMNKSNLFVEGETLYRDDDNNENNIIWTNEMCMENKSPLGSCRFANKECIDFITQDSCDKLKMEWSEKTCQDSLPYKFIDKVKFKLPEPKYELVQMFPS